APDDVIHDVGLHLQLDQLLEADLGLEAQPLHEISGVRHGLGIRHAARGVRDIRLIEDIDALHAPITVELELQLAPRVRGPTPDQHGVYESQSLVETLHAAPLW